VAESEFYLQLAETNLTHGDARAAAASLAEALAAGLPATHHAARELAARARASLPPGDPALERLAPLLPARAEGQPVVDAIRRLLVTPELVGQLRSLVGDEGGDPTLPLAEVLASLLGADLDVDRAASVALDLVVRATGAARGFLVLCDQRSFGEATPPEASRGILEEVLRGGHTVVVADGRDDPRFGTRESVTALNVRSVLCAPVRAGGAIVAAIYLEADKAPAGFTPAERELTEALAALAGPALERARAYGTQRSARARAERLYAQARASAPGAPQLLGRSPAIRDLLEQVQRHAPGEHAVLIEGESGTGKELVARTLHAASGRSGPFVAENLAALSASVVESELFGHVRGAFTGAHEDRPGLFQLAAQGTLLLDEVGELPAPLQAKLLRVLQEREVRPLGGSARVPISARILAATHRDLRAEVRAGRFREDLYYRLATVRVVVPPLRKRKGDLPLLLEHFLARAAVRCQREPPELSPALRQRLASYPWPGNVRELMGYATRLVLEGPDHAQLDARASQEIALGGGEQPLRVAVELSGPPLGLKDARAVFERAYLQLVLERHDTVAAAAEALGVHRSYVFQLIRRHGLR
jgi:serine/threonine-protein kinase PknK